MNAPPPFAAISLRTRVSTLVGLAAVLVLGVAAWVIDWRVDGEMARRFDDALLARAQALVALTRYERGGLELEGDAQARGVAAAHGDARAWFRLRCDGRDVAGDAAAAVWPAPDVAAMFADHPRADGTLVRVVRLRFTPGLGDTWGTTPPARATAWRAAGAARLPDCTL
ncbi:MAG TPA: sensor histidine kinase N-terminal domain-containing protein, partial [Mizugakiibacter sp.]